MACYSKYVGAADRPSADRNGTHHADVSGMRLRESGRHILGVCFGVAAQREIGPVQPAPSRSLRIRRVHHACICCADREGAGGAAGVPPPALLGGKYDPEKTRVWGTATLRKLQGGPPDSAANRFAVAALPWTVELLTRTAEDTRGALLFRTQVRPPEADLEGRSAAQRCVLRHPLSSVARAHVALVATPK